MKKIRTLELNRRTLYLLCFLIPLLVMVGCMVGFGVAPFGDHSFVIIDGLHQYLPFYSVLYDKLKAGEGLFFSFRIGLGVNFLSLFSYYLSSPFNLLILFFKKTQLPMVVSLLIVLKIALSGLTAGIYFCHKSKKPDLPILAGACLYALNSYMVGYSWNVMWLDAIMIFPIIMLGIDKLAEEGDGRLYCIALFYALYCNYYIGFMICIFCILWFLQSSFPGFREFRIRAFWFAVYSLLAGGMAAVILLPAWMGIRQTASGGEMALPAHSWLTGFADILARQFAMTTPVSHDNFDGNINLYFGIFAFIIVVLYLLNREISLLDKIRKSLILALLYFSFNEKILNFIWHGFHDQYGIPNRFSFLFGFVLALMLVEVFDHKKAVKHWQTVLAALAGIGLLYLGSSRAGKAPEDLVLAAAGVLLLFYATIAFLMTMDRHHKKWYARIFCLAATLEMAVTAVVGFYYIGQISISKFFSGTGDVEKGISALEDGSFYRSELADTLLVDESTWHRMNGVSLFGSTARAETVDIMDNLGFYSACNEYLYQGPCPLTNVMLNVRYQFFHPGDDLRTEFHALDKFGSMEVYENPVQGMSVGYAIDDAILNWYSDSAYPFVVLNDFSYQGYSYDSLFKTFAIADPATSGCKVERTNDGEYHFFFEEARDDNMVFTIQIPETIPAFYLFYDGTQVENAIIMADDRVLVNGDKDGTMLYLGRVEAGENVTVRFRLKGEEKSGYVRLSAAAFDQEIFHQLTADMTSRAFQVSEWSSGHLKGTVQTGSEQMLFLSIPFDKGWTALVDGKRAPLMAIGNAFLGIPMEEGEHQVELSYVPPGFDKGWKLSLLSLIIYSLLWASFFFRKKKKKSRKAHPGRPHDSRQKGKKSEEKRSGETKTQEEIVQEEIASEETQAEPQTGEIQTEEA